jgi:precorrin-6A/cobalt-precorrin-6A reductase
VILLLGGTTEGVELARALTDAGCSVLVSQATEIEMALPDTPLLSVRRGRLDRDGFARLVAERGVRAVVDASHPFATGLRAMVLALCRETGLPRIRLERARCPLPPQAIVAPDHAVAAVRAFEMARVVLLTTGSRNLTEYVKAARAVGGELWARVAPSVESERSVREAGLAPERVEWAKGPFAMRDTVELLERSAAGVLVTKDSGANGGLPAKLEAARRRGARVVVLARPLPSTDAVGSGDEVLAWLRALPSAGAGSA